MRCKLSLLLLVIIAQLTLIWSENNEKEENKEVSSGNDSTDDEADVEDETHREDVHFQGGGPHQHPGDHIAPEFLGPAPTLIEEVKNKIRMMFPAADYNHDDHLDEQELARWNNKQIREFVHMNTKAQMRMIDANEDGRVNWQEFLRGMYGDKESRTKNKEVQKAIYKDRRRFDIADRNQDNELNFDELGLMIHPEEHTEMNDVFVEEMMDGLDTDGDGFISLKEYTSEKEDLFTANLNSIFAFHAGDRPEDNPTRKKMEEQFRSKFDLNGDEKLDKTEMKELIFPENKDLAALEAYHVFLSLDKDKNGFVTLQDLLQHHEIIAGSKGMHYFSILQRQHPPDDYSRKEEL